MPHQIEHLQAQFYSLNLDQKREFITNLQDEMHYSSDPEWRAYIQPFISKCIKEYNEEISRPAGPAAMPPREAAGAPGMAYSPARSPGSAKLQSGDVLNAAVGDARMAYENSRNSPPMLALADGEQVVRSYHCIKQGFIFQTNGFLTATNRRIIFQGQSMFTKADTEIPLEAVSVISSGFVRFHLIFLLLALSFLFEAIIGGTFIPMPFDDGISIWIRLLNVVIAIIFGIIAFMPRCSLSIAAANNSGQPSVFVNAILRNKSHFRLKGRPTGETDAMFQELGAMVTDLQKLGDFGVQKWAK